ncbi:Crp/Fnr family transcriptional regulator [Croceibacterium ferulae]|uniref:Crp/Fnr family transcriptional regulator n=1 Tax=Croceibacterium ferulae TaxID=1854641 RepID=UPI000EB58563|nr:Crp/Fnr family transcriptional regulator [Croceibacterium ferulae]
MSQPDQFHTTNTLLLALAAEDLALIVPHLSRVKLVRKQVLVIPNEPVEHVYFPEGGIASIVSDMARSGRTETGIFGREGVSATCLLLGTDRTPHESFMQVGDSTALRIDAARYLDLVQHNASIRTVLLRYVQTALIQAAQSTATNAQFRVEARLARWLLMCHDRIDGDEIELTHEFMSMMNSADRSGVTVTLHIMEGAGLIRSLRGRVVIRDREKLEELAGDSYGVPEAEYRRLIGPLGQAHVVLPLRAHGNGPD